jgi:hypothetical protein
VGGALSRGEWATLLRAVFDRASDTTFEWTRWANLRGKRYHVYRYRVDQEHSRETLDADGKKVTPAFHGDIYVPYDSEVVWWITVEPEPPADFPMQDVKETLKYNYVDISGQKFLLPLTSEVVMREGRIGSHNEIQFRAYQKYSANAVIKFDDVDDPPAKPEDDNKKKPPK